MSDDTTVRGPRRDVLISEVGPRDGLQNLDRVMATADKLAWIEGEAACGVPEIEIGSFRAAEAACPRWPITGDLLARLPDLPGTEFAVLVPNLKGAERAVAAGARKLTLTISASEAHSLKNVRKTPAEQVEEFKRIIRLRDGLEPGSRFELAAGVSTAFGCTLQGAVPEADVGAPRGRDGAGRGGRGQPGGHGGLRRSRRRCGGSFGRCGRKIGDLPMAGHFHDTRGLGLANVLAAYEEGVGTFDSTLGGLGGCPYAPGGVGQCGDRGSGVPVRAHGGRHRHRSGAADRAAPPGRSDAAGRHLLWASCFGGPAARLPPGGRRRLTRWVRSVPNR